jgi:hypothetical protein
MARNEVIRVAFMCAYGKASGTAHAAVFCEKGHEVALVTSGKKSCFCGNFSTIFTGMLVRPCLDLRPPDPRETLV